MVKPKCSPLTCKLKQYVVHTCGEADPVRTRTVEAKVQHFGDSHTVGVTKLYFQTEGSNAQGKNYHSDQCQALTTDFRKLAHELLDEFLDAFARDPATATLLFKRCEAHS